MRWRSTDYYERDGSPVFQLANDQGRIVRKYLIPWDQVWQARLDFLGESFVVDMGGGVGYISRRTPHHCTLPGAPPYSGNGQPAFFAASIAESRTVEPRGHEVPRAMAKYRWAEMSINYVPFSYLVRDDNDPAMRGGLGSLPDEATLNRYVTRVPKASYRAFTLPQSINRWVPQAGSGVEEPVAPVLESMAKVEGLVEITYIHHARPDSVIPLARRHLGTVNQETFDGWPPETLLLHSADQRQVVLPGDGFVYDAQYVMKGIVRLRTTGDGASVPSPEHVGWNHAPRRLGGRTATPFYDWRRLSGSGAPDGTKPYLLTDFKKLFRPA